MEKNNLKDLLGTPNGFYPYKQQCPNCAFVNRFEIPKGTTTEDFLSKTACLNCGCNIGYLLKKIFST